MIEMKLFDCGQRNDEAFAKYTESHFSWLNRSSLPVAERIRNILENWFSHYPADEQLELRKRFRSSQADQSFPAFFELYLHELLICLGCDIVLHPSVPASAKKPDFLVITPDSQRFYLEAVAVMDESRRETNAYQRLNKVFDAINSLESQDILLSIRVISLPDRSPSLRRIKHYVTQRLAEVNNEHLLNQLQLEGLDGLPQWEYEQDGLHLVLSPIPITSDSHDLSDPSGLIGIVSHAAYWVTIQTAMREAIIKKGQRYGLLDIPYVIAVNAIGETADRRRIINVLYGDERNLISPNQFEIAEMRFDRQPDGVWVSPKGPRYTRISAVLVASELIPASMEKTDLCLYHNPWADKPYSSILTCLSQAVLNEKKILWKGGIPASNILKFPLS
jgi:hypothetical protein